MKLAIDSSAIVAIFLKEPEAEALWHILRGAQVAHVCAASILETQMVLSRRYPDGGANAIDKFIADQKLIIVPFDGNLLMIARTAFLKYGKGRHPAGLNFGDCMAYALAKSMRLPLLFKGDVFALTDIERAV